MKATRKDYMDGKVSHDEYYEQIAEECGISYANSRLLPGIKKALAAGDEHLNDYKSLQWWDMRAAMTQSKAFSVCKERGDQYSLSSGVCIHKAAARKAALG